MNIFPSRLSPTILAVATLFAAGQAAAIAPFTIRDIRIEGLQRVEPGTVFASIPLRVGETYDDDKASAAIRALYALGVFKDVRIEVADDVVVVAVEERPTVAGVEFSGVREFDKEVLMKSLREVGLAEGRPYDKALIDRATQELKRQYINRSLYGAEIQTTVTPIERNRVNLTFTVTEGSPARIKEIRIVGNQAFSESTLRGLFELDTGNWLSWYTKSDRYSRTKLNGDLETLKSYYLSRGYIDFRIDSTQVAISPDKQEVSIIINITEGEPYIVSEVDLAGNYLNREDEFKQLITVKAGQPYNANDVAETTKAFTDRFGDFGFAFARVEARPEIDRARRVVRLVFAADPSRRVYVRRININGNDRTRDEVIRREFRQYEAAWYDGRKIRLSRDRVDRLGYFTEVNIETADVPGAPDQVDLNLTVAEKPTSSVQVGAGFSSAERLSLNFSFKQENAFGTGQYLAVELNTSKFNRVLVLSSVDPYFTADGISRSFDIYHRSSKPYNNYGGNYELITEGGSLRFGVPFTENDTVFFGGGIERTRIKTGTNIPAEYLAYAEQFGYTSNTVPLTVGWARDDRDSALAPNRGRYQRFNTEWGVGGDARFIKLNYQFQQFVPLSRQYTLAFNSEFGWGKGLNGRPFPVFKNFYSGGLGSVRGFEQSTLGPRSITGTYAGGPKKITLNGELVAPFPGAGNDKTLRLFAFTDVGTVWGESEKVDLSQMRASAGVGISWISPVGPLRLAWATPVRKFAGDKIQKLQFQIGTSF
ncbi:outer membrane protein assembly factor BamA [Tibeticola sp.]|jgi:outer membrane protein insertion porin family|uniref:outer membrane protein assembly factor BamA n=1 Tax=Tibeticola sp. TaxID=2005368 RepID=UPI00258FE09F|nr:outer membrane protein assembly factor BamA [Tibeticola sp.]MCI4441521.1 outer membrane protein assembly factor BamA [Tibeticola sp.]